MKTLLTTTTLALAMIGTPIVPAQAQSATAYNEAACHASFIQSCIDNQNQQTLNQAVLEAPAPVLAAGGVSGGMVMIGTITAWTRRRRSQSGTPT